MESCFRSENGDIIVVGTGGERTPSDSGQIKERREKESRWLRAETISNALRIQRTNELYSMFANTEDFARRIGDR